MFAILPNDINSANFLTAEEKQYAEDRVVIAGTGRYSLKNNWKADQAIECLLDPKTWFFVAISILTQVRTYIVLFCN
jgi:hypothetical protein